MTVYALFERDAKPAPAVVPAEPSSTPVVRTRREPEATPASRTRDDVEP